MDVPSLRKVLERNSVRLLTVVCNAIKEIRVLNMMNIQYQIQIGSRLVQVWSIWMRDTATLVGVTA